MENGSNIVFRKCVYFLLYREISALFDLPEVVYSWLCQYLRVEKKKCIRTYDEIFHFLPQNRKIVSYVSYLNVSLKERGNNYMYTNLIKYR